MPFPVVAVVVHYQTPDLLETAVRSFADAYPDVPLVVVDNGSDAADQRRIDRLEEDLPLVTSIRLVENIYHGPAMHRALKEVDEQYLFFLDSDTETLRPGFLERMVALLEEAEDRYAAGELVRVDRRGFAAEQGTPVVTSWHMLLKRRLYHRLPPFEHHGLPVLRNFRAAAEEGFDVCDFPVQEYVHHYGRGTVSRFGYGLGWRSRISYLLHRLGW